MLLVGSLPKDDSLVLRQDSIEGHWEVVSDSYRGFTFDFSLGLLCISDRRGIPFSMRNYKLDPSPDPGFTKLAFDKSVYLIGIIAIDGDNLQVWVASKSWPTYEMVVRRYMLRRCRD